MVDERANGVSRFMGRRPLALAAGCYALGALLGYYAGVAPLCWSLPLALLALTLLFWRRAALVFAALMLAGASVVSSAAFKPAVEPREDVVIEGRVAQPAIRNESSVMLELEGVHIGGETHPYRLRVYAYGDLELPVAGDTVRMRGETWLPQGQRNPGGFDFAAYLWTRGVPLCASANADTFENLGARGFSLSGAFGVLRQRIGERIDALFPENAPLVRALLLGDRAGLPPELVDDFRAAGLSHLLAISGLHVSCLAFALEALLRLLRIPRRRAVLATLALLLGYAALIGFPASVVRAALMFALVRGAILAGRPSDALTGLSAAALLILMFRPLWIADAGFQLSFAAVGGMLLLTEPVRKLLRIPAKPHMPDLRRPKSLLRWAALWALNLGATGIAIQLGTLPVVATCFYQVQPLAPLLNLIAIPLTTLALPLSALKLIVCGLIPAAARWAVLALPDRLLALLERLATTASGSGLAPLGMPGWPGWLLVLYLGSALCASPFLRIPLRGRKGFLCALPLLALCAVLYARLLLPGGLHLAVLDAGQANAVVVRAEGSAYLVDVGKPNGPAPSYLLYTGQRPKAVFLTHPHADHAGGLGALLDTAPPETIYLPECWARVPADDGIAEQIERARDMGVQLAYLAAGDEIQLSDGALCRVLQPEFGYVPRSGNGASLVLHIAYGGGSALMMGDLPGAEELPLYPDVDVLLSPHHGSGSSNSERLLLLASPSALIVPVGRNGYGHPAARVLESAQLGGARVYRTDECGAVFAQIQPDGGVQMRTYLAMDGEAS